MMLGHPESAEAGLGTWALLVEVAGEAGEGAVGGVAEAEVAQLPRL